MLETIMVSNTNRQSEGGGQTKKATASGWIGSALAYYDFLSMLRPHRYSFRNFSFPQATLRSPSWRHSLPMVWDTSRGPSAPSFWVAGATSTAAKTYCLFACFSRAFQQWPSAFCQRINRSAYSPQRFLSSCVSSRTSLLRERYRTPVR